jgi:hypothetical protein
MRAFARGGLVLVLSWTLFAGTLGWFGVAGAPVGYVADVSASAFRAEFLLPGDLPPEFTQVGVLSMSGGRGTFEMDWRLRSGGSVRISERVVPYAILFGGEPTAEEMVALAGLRGKWDEAISPNGQNALKATIGRIHVLIEGPLSYDDLFRIARSLRPGYASLLLL